MDTETWRRLVGQRVAERRRELKIKSMRKAASIAGIHESTWRPVESGYKVVTPGVRSVASPEEETKVAVCRALLWTPDSIDRMLNDEDPIEVKPANAPLVLTEKDGERLLDLSDFLTDLAKRVVGQLPGGRQ